MSTRPGTGRLTGSGKAGRAFSRQFKDGTEVLADGGNGGRHSLNTALAESIRLYCNKGIVVTVPCKP
jgi:hypothetical protein